MSELQCNVEARVTSCLAHPDTFLQLDELGAGLSRHFGATVRRFVVDAAAPRIAS